MSTRAPVCRAFLACLATLALSGCVGVSSYYSKEDLSKPNADFTGEWVDEKGQYFSVRQTGKEASIHFGEWGDATGEVQGRVLLATGRHCDIALSMKEDLTSARLGSAWGGGVGDDRRAYKIRLGASEDELSFNGDPASAGGLICQLPTKDGAPRRILVSLVYHYNLQGVPIPVRVLAPLEPDAKPWTVAFPGDSVFKFALLQDSLAQARRRCSFSKKIEGTLDGAPCWWVLAPGWSAEARGPQPNLIAGELYRADPDSGAAPVEVCGLLHRAPGGPWRTIEGKGYVLSSSKVARARAVLQGGIPVRVEVDEMQAPPVEEFLVLQEPFVRLARWRNHALLDVKNRTLPKVLVEYKTSDLTALSGRIEKLILDLNHEAESLRDKAQKSARSWPSISGSGSAKSRRSTLSSRIMNCPRPSGSGSSPARRS